MSGHRPKRAYTESVATFLMLLATVRICELTKGWHACFTLFSITHRGASTNRGVDHPRETHDPMTKTVHL
ncbi:MAG: hypothetical protein AAGJ40_07515 [Planctomycetota bacterium]